MQPWPSKWPFAVLLSLTACSEARITVGDDGATAGGGQALDASVYLQASTSGEYVVAELGGGGQVNCNRADPGPWESFALRDLDGPPLQHGDQVQLRTWDGAHWLSAEGGGGSGLHAHATAGAGWETFTLLRAAGAGPLGSGDEVALRTSTGHFVVAEEGGGGMVNANRTAAGAWETFRLHLGQAPSASSNEVLPEDTVLVPSRPRGPVLGTVTGYEMNSHCPFADASRCEQPMYLKYDRDDPEWWDVLVDELLASRVNVVMAHGRGCYSPTSGDTGNGNMCPRLLRHLVAAIDRAGALGVLRLGMFDDTGAYQGTRDTVDGRPQSERFDLADASSWRFFWDHNMRVWFDTVPKELWYRLDGRPVVAFWSLSSFFFQNQQGNASRLLADLRQKFLARYGEDPVFIVDQTWVSEDSTVNAQVAQGVNDWFDPSHAVFTWRSWGGAKWGATTPGFKDPDNVSGCGAACRERPRRDGASLREALEAGQSGGRFALLEGWTDIAESAGYYRSAAWRFPNQYIGIVREYADADVRTLRLEAESADTVQDSTAANEGGAYRAGPLDVGKLPGSGWFVGWAAPGESLAFEELALPCGTYRITARLAVPAGGQRVRAALGGQSVGAVDVPATGSWDAYGLVHLGAVKVPRGKHRLEISFETGGVNLDWVFLRRAADACP